MRSGRQGWPSLRSSLNDTAARPCLDGREHGVIVAGSDDRQESETLLPFNGCYELTEGGSMALEYRPGMKMYQVI